MLRVRGAELGIPVRVMIPDPEPGAPPAPAAKTTLKEVKYSLPDLLGEIAAEKGSASFAMEKLDQAEIGKLFKTKKPVRVKPKT